MGFLALEAEGDIVDQVLGNTCERYYQNGDFLFDKVFFCLRYLVTRAQNLSFEITQIGQKVTKIWPLCFAVENFWHTNFTPLS